MKSNELRLGNCVNIEVSNGDETVKFTNGIITEISKRVRVNDIVFDYENLVPISLTEHWLLKAGFEKDDSGVDMFDQDYCEWYQKEFPLIGLLCQSSDKSYIFDENTDTLRLKYVHQLQNLYFALTGQELEFKEIEKL